LLSDSDNVINQKIKFMNIFINKVLLFSVILISISCSSPGGNENTVILMQTTSGDIKIKLYDGTPIHRDNFIKLVKSGFYEGVSFHRVIQDFMIQGGDPLTKTPRTTNMPDSMNTYTIPAEFRPEYFHKKGALAAAREGNDVNPYMRSSGTQFYIVQGIKYSETDLAQAEQRINSNLKQGMFSRFLKEVQDSAKISGKTVSDAEIQDLASVKMFEFLNNYKEYKIPDDHRIAYTTLGGVPRLDGTYTVFGEVMEGFDVVDKIAAVKTDSSDKPVSDVKILKIKILRH
jgi:peptidylprolyl isomerase